jgi:hypothetical protein
MLSTSCQRHDGATVPESLRKAARTRAFVIHCECAVGLFHAVIGYLLVLRVGHFDVRSTSNALVFAVSAFLIGLQLARHFGQFHGGNTPER